MEGGCEREGGCEGEVWCEREGECAFDGPYCFTRGSHLMIYESDIRRDALRPIVAHLKLLRERGTFLQVAVPQGPL